MGLLTRRDHCDQMGRTQDGTGYSCCLAKHHSGDHYDALRRAYFTVSYLTLATLGGIPRAYPVQPGGDRR